MSRRGRIRTQASVLSPPAFLPPDEVRARTPHGDGDRTARNQPLGAGSRPAYPCPQDLAHLTEVPKGHQRSSPSPRKKNKMGNKRQRIERGRIMKVPLKKKEETGAPQGDSDNKQSTAAAACVCFCPLSLCGFWVHISASKCLHLHEPMRAFS